jgi:penicillin-binding protein 2
VATGQVLTAYSNPTFDPNLMTISISTADWNALSGDPAKPFFNRVVQATYPPASLYKPVTSLAALQNRVVGRETYLEPCLGGWEFGNRFFRCWKRSGHGDVDHTEAIVQSCDTFYYQLALRLDLDDLATAARAFGLGRTCTRLFPDEAAGNIPDRAFYDRRFGEGRWTRGVMLNNAIGQGELLVTPIQIAVLAGRVATSGRMPDPEFVLIPPQPTARPAPLPFRETDLAWVRRALTETVERGTGRQATLEGIPVAGKTGTAQNPHGEDHAWFMCYAPADAPEVAVAVIIENAGHGSTEAAPVAGAWLEAYFRRKGRLAPEPGAESGS